MKTEEEIIYSIIETVKKGEVNQDDRLNERLIRSFLHKYRASILSQYTRSGMTVSDDCFQNLTLNTFYSLGNIVHTLSVPQLIRFKDNHGIILEAMGESIPVVSREEFTLSMKDRINGKLPKANFMDGSLRIFKGILTDTSCGLKPKDNAIIHYFHETHVSALRINLSAVFMNPDDVLGYDWTSDPFPVDSELLSIIVQSILDKEFNIIIQVGTDKVTDGDQKQEI